MPEKKPKMTQTLDNISKNVRNISFLVGVLIAIGTTIVVTIDQSIDKKLGAYFDVNITERFAELDERTSANEYYIRAQIEKNILKQHDKIKNDPQDIKRADLEDALKYYYDIANPSPQLKIAFAAVEKYYNEKY